jgi:hypothetical protein
VGRWAFIEAWSNRSTVAKIISRLLEKGSRSVGEVGATPGPRCFGDDEGQRLLKVAEPVARTVDGLPLAVIPKAQREPLLAALQAIVGNLEAAG